MKTLPVGFGGVNLGRRNETVHQPRFGLGTEFNDVKLDEPLMDAFIPLLEANGGHLEKKPEVGDILEGRADANPDGTITVQAEVNTVERDGNGGEIPRKSVFEAVVDRDGNPIRIKVLEAKGSLEDEATVLPDDEREKDKLRPHPLEGIKRLLDHPTIAVNAVIHAIDRTMQGMLPRPLN